MKLSSHNIFTTVRTEGAILPPDLLQQVVDGSRTLDGLTPASYHLLEGEKINEAINRSWHRLRGAWSNFQAALDQLPPNDPGTSVTRERFLLPLFQELGYGRLPIAKALSAGDKNYPISHGYQHLPIHLVGWRVDLDTRTSGVAGASRSSPHSLVQELLNRSHRHLWAFVSNGRYYRILRDNASLTRQAYVEFDLEAMMTGEVYADFVLLWLLCHQSRVEAENPEQCWLEKWSRYAQERGIRAFEHLRDSVEAAIKALGQGFLIHPTNRELRHKLQSGTVSAQDYNHQLRRLVYQLLFLFVVEDRDALLDPAAPLVAREQYRRFYSAARLRYLAERQRGTRHCDLFHVLRLVGKKLGDAGCPELGLPALGSFLWSREAIADLEGCQIANSDLLDAVRALAFVTDRHGRRPVDYKHLKSRELGSIYESLLELHPEINVTVGTFDLKTAAGNRRKTTGCYYTPENLVECLLDSALDPVLNQATRHPEPEQAILNLKVCDTACGSGHFLTAAAYRMAKRLATVRTGEEEPSPEAIRTALRQVISRCIYGVDVNRMAVELCKVALWMEAMEPGKPLPFLEHHIQWGDSLFGATPALIANGVPDEAFSAIEGDDKAICSQQKKQNRKEREQGQLTLVDPTTKPWGWLENIALYAPEHQPWQQLEEMAAQMLELDQIADESIAQVRLKQEKYQALLHSTEYRFSRFRADAWCAAFVWERTQVLDYAITEEIFRKIKQNPYNAPDWMKQEVERLAQQHHFFHWHVAFAHIFRVPKHKREVENQQAGWLGGFDVELGNTPWERIKLQEREWFAAHRPDIANAVTAADRKRKIQALKTEDPALYTQFLQRCRQADGESHFVHHSGRFPLCGRGDINTFAIFAETNRLLLSATGRMGCIVPSGIATADTTKFFFQELMNSGCLASFYDFENREQLLFPDIDARMRFALITLAGSNQPMEKADFVFFAHNLADLDMEDRRINLTVEDIALLNPHTKTCPIFRSKWEFEIAKQIYARVPILGQEEAQLKDSWRLKIASGLFDQTTDGSCLWTTETNMTGKPLRAYEARMIGSFNHRECSAATTDKNLFRTGVSVEITDEQRQDPNFGAMPRYWASESETHRRIPETYPYQWFIGFKDVTSATNHRTMIACVIPKAAVLASIRLVLFDRQGPAIAAGLLANWNSFCFDFICRQSTSGNHLSGYIVRQLPTILPSVYTHECPWNSELDLKDWLLPRVLELTYTAWDLQSFAQDCGYMGAPFRWDEERRGQLRCELDAAYFHLYGIGPEDVGYILETFPISKRKDEQRYGHFRTKEMILQIYDAMAVARYSGKPYRTCLEPPAADLRVAHAPLLH